MKDVLLIYLFVGLCSIVWALSDDNSVIQDEDDADDEDNGDDSEDNGVDDDDNGYDDEDNRADDDDSGYDDKDNGVDDDDNGDDDDDNEGADDDNRDDYDDKGDDDLDDSLKPAKQFLIGAVDPKADCWMNISAAEHFKTMDTIDAEYKKDRQAIQKSLEDKSFDTIMVQNFTQERGQAQRELYTHKGRMIPSGINLGGLCMLRMPESVLFFHRMKLRNNTYFHVEYLHNDLENMVITINMRLNDLHLMGAFERSLTEKDPSVLTYAPTFGEVEFLLKDVKYTLEGRYSVAKERLRIEMISSNILCDDNIMKYKNIVIESSTEKIEQRNLDNFLSRLKVDLDLWVKDYFNDYLVLDADMDGINLSKLAVYDKKKRAALQEFADSAIKKIRNRIRIRGAQNVRIPSFSFESIHTTGIKLLDGVLHGLDSMYRRSVVTGYKKKETRSVDCEVGFTNLKIVYRYEASIPTGLPVLTGMLTLSANEVTAHLALKMLSQPEVLDLDIEFLGQMKPESLTVEGPANLMISNYRHLLEHQIIALMSNNLIYGVKMLKSLPGCEPFMPGQIIKKKKKEVEKEVKKEEEKKEKNETLKLAYNYNQAVETDESESVATFASREYWSQKRQPNKSQEPIKKRLRSEKKSKKQKKLKKTKH